MGLKIKPEGMEHAPKEIINIRIYLAACAAASAAIMIGYDSAFFGTTISLSSFKNEFGWVAQPAGRYTTVQLANMSANIVSVYQAGAFFGALSAYPLGYFFGRRIGMLTAALVTILGAGLMCGANGSRGDGLIYGGRAIAGVGVGIASSLSPLYLSEISPPQIRGQVIGLYEIGWQIGGLVGFWIVYGVQRHIPAGHSQWLTPIAVQLIPAGMFAILLIFCKESPRWLLTNGKRDKAIKTLSYIRNLPEDHDYLIAEVNAITVQVEHDITAVGPGFLGPIKGVFTKWYLTRRLLLTSTLFMWQNGTGINAVNYYSPTFFRSIGLTGERTPLLTTGVFGVIKTLGALLWAFWWVDRYGRKAVLILGSIGGAVGMLVIGIILGVTNPAGVRPVPTSLPASGGAAVAFFYIWTAFYAIGWNGTPWVVNSESFPGSVRQVCATMAAASNWLWNFVISRATPTMFLRMGHSGFGVYLFFAGMQIVSIFYVWFLLPETKGIPLESMDALFEEYKSTPRKAHGKVMEQLENERLASAGQHEEYLKATGETKHYEGSHTPTSEDEKVRV